MSNENRLNSAATDGLLLSTITIVASLIQSTFKIDSMIIASLLWLMKFGGCIYLLHWCMNRQSLSSGGSSYMDSFKYGFLVCAFSSIVCAGYMLLSLTLLFPEQTNMIIEQATKIMEQGNYSSEEKAAFDSLSVRLPQLTSMTSFVYYVIIGAVMSSVIANFTKKE
jgi:hypothetical protein